MRWAMVIFGMTMLLGAEQVLAQEPNAFNQLLAARSLKCTFGPGSQADWKGGRLKLELVDGGLPESHFNSIDLQKGTARLISNIGAADVAVLLSLKGISFLEETGSGNFNFTTVFAESSSEGGFIVVTSRHLHLISAPFVIQFHGTCKVWQ